MPPTPDKFLVYNLLGEIGNALIGCCEERRKLLYDLLGSAANLFSQVLQSRLCYQALCLQTSFDVYLRRPRLGINLLFRPMLHTYTMYKYIDILSIRSLLDDAMRGFRTMASYRGAEIPIYQRARDQKMGNFGPAAECITAPFRQGQVIRTSFLREARVVSVWRSRLPYVLPRGREQR